MVPVVRVVIYIACGTRITLISFFEGKILFEHHFLWQGDGNDCCRPTRRKKYGIIFLVACTRLYNPLCRSIGPPVGPSVTLSFFSLFDVILGYFTSFYVILSHFQSFSVSFSHLSHFVIFCHFCHFMLL